MATEQPLPAKPTGCQPLFLLRPRSAEDADLRDLAETILAALRTVQQQRARESESDQAGEDEGGEA